jgi:hypothetical protein
MFLNIITPCSRPENLHKISQSINIPKENYRWIIVCDMDELPDSGMIPDNCEIHLHRNPKGSWGHSQRNFGIDLITEGYVYCNDDDTIIHPNLWENIKDLNEDFISFKQEDKNGEIRLNGDSIRINFIDSHNFMVSRQTIGDSKWLIDSYAADGHFAMECYDKSLTKKYVPLVLSTYNSLR